MDDRICPVCQRTAEELADAGEKGRDPDGHDRCDEHEEPLVERSSRASTKSLDLHALRDRLAPSPAATSSPAFASPPAKVARKPARG